MGFPRKLNVWKQRLGWASSIEVILLLLVFTLINLRLHTLKNNLRELL